VAAAAGGAVLGEAEVGELGVEVLAGRMRSKGELEGAVHAHDGGATRGKRRGAAYRVEEDVGGLEVPVDDVLLRRVQEGQPAGGANGDAQPEAPRQRLHGCSGLWLMMHRKTKELPLVHHRHILILTSEQSTIRLACADNATDRPSMCHSPQHKDLVFFPS